MSADRELLELAAKAAGFSDMVWWEEMHCFQIPGDLETKLWNPLTDDGDALRLAVYVKIDVYFEEGAPEVGASTGHHGPWVMGALEFIQEDAFAATRRAIVLAAAEVGKKL